MGAIEHRLIDARAAYFEQVLKYLIMGNVKRGGVYPLCVGRGARAAGADHCANRAAIEIQRRGARLHRRRNDQVRFEVALRTLAPDLEIIAPVRDRAFKRPEQLQYLEQHGLPDPAVRRRVFGESRTVGASPSAARKRSPRRARCRTTPGCCRRMRSATRRGHCA